MPSKTHLVNELGKRYVGIARRAIEEVHAALETIYSVNEVDTPESDDESIDESSEDEEEEEEEEEVIQDCVALSVGQRVKLPGDDTVYVVKRQRHLKHSIAQLMTSRAVQGKTYYSHELIKI